MEKPRGHSEIGLRYAGLEGSLSLHGDLPRGIPGLINCLIDTELSLQKTFD